MRPLLPPEKLMTPSLSSPPILKFAKVRPEAHIPVKAHEEDACTDIFASLKGVDYVKTSFSYYFVESDKDFAWLDGKEVKEVIELSSRSNSVVLPPNSSTIIPTGIAFNIPRGYRLDFKSRSGRAAKYRQSLGNGIGTIDCGYPDEVFIILVNDSAEAFEIKDGEKIAQFSLEKVLPYQMLEAPLDLLQIEDTGRTGGLGSTGD